MCQFWELRSDPPPFYIVCLWRDASTLTAILFHYFVSLLLFGGLAIVGLLLLIIRVVRRKKKHLSLERQQTFSTKRQRGGSVWSNASSDVGRASDSLPFLSIKQRDSAALPFGDRPNSDDYEEVERKRKSETEMITFTQDSVKGSPRVSTSLSRVSRGGHSSSRIEAMLTSVSTVAYAFVMLTYSTLLETSYKLLICTTFETESGDTIEIMRSVRCSFECGIISRMSG